MVVSKTEFQFSVCVPCLPDVFSLCWLEPILLSREGILLRTGVHGKQMERSLGEAPGRDNFGYLELLLRVVLQELEVSRCRKERLDAALFPMA